MTSLANSTIAFDINGQASDYNAFEMNATLGYNATIQWI